MSTTTQHRLRSEVGGITTDAYPHAASVWMVVVLRLLMGGVMLFGALGKITGSEPFSAYGYLAHVDPASPASGLYAAMATNALLLDVVNVVVPATQLLIGLALIAGAFVRLAALGGALQMAAFYLGGWQATGWRYSTTRWSMRLSSRRSAPSQRAACSASTATSRPSRPGANH